jgi:hypothetical protein
MPGVTLFALIGIAGEDDLDAPDLNAPAAAQSGAKKPLLNGRPNWGRNHFGRKIPAGRDVKGPVGSANAVLSAIALWVHSQLRNVR